MEHLGINISISWILGITACILAYMYSTWTYDHFRKIGISGPTPWPLLGNLVTLWCKGLRQFMFDAHKKYGPVFGMFEGRKPMLFVKDTEMLKQILVKEFATFTNRRSLIQDVTLQNSLPNLKDDAWRRVRTQMTPAFSSGKLKQMNLAINDSADIMVTNMIDQSKSGDVDIKRVTNAFTMDVICRTVFGIRVDSQKNPDNPLVKNAMDMAKNFSLIKILLAVAFPRMTSFLQRNFSVHLFPRKALDFFSRMADETITYRQKADKTQVDMMYLMLKANEIEPDTADIEGDNVIGFKYESAAKGKKGMSKSELLSNSVIFFLAGSETTASTLAYLLYSLATNQEVHKHVTNEIDEVVGNETVITPTMTTNLVYLDRVIHEVLRLYPLALASNRVCTKDIEIKGVKIQKGTIVSIPIYALHHDASHWPDPEKFDPDRFLPEATAQRDPLTWIPFGFGPRICIGMRLALTEIKIAAAKLLQKFSFQTCEQTEIPMKFKKSFLLSTVNPIMLKVEQRQ